MARDVFRSPKAPYVLKLQAGKWHTTSIAAEAIRATTIHQATVTIHSLQRMRAQAGGWQLDGATAFSAESGLPLEVAAEELTQWLPQLAAPQQGMGNTFNTFQWQGFWIGGTEARALCESALRHAARSC